MNDMSTTIIAKSDQINAADLIGTSRTITIKEVRIKAGEDQPVSVLIEGDKKAFRPCKGVRRLMVRVWGADASKYIGESMTIFCDPSVTWAGKEEGGIRVSHMSGLDEKIIEYMRVNRAGTKPYEILPLVVGRRSAPARSDPAVTAMIAKVKATTSVPDLAALMKAVDPELNQMTDEQANAIFDAANAHKAVLKSGSTRPKFDAGEEGRTDEQHGDQHTDDETARKAPVTANDIKTRADNATTAEQITNLTGVLETERGTFTQAQVDEVEMALSDARARL